MSVLKEEIPVFSVDNVRTAPRGRTIEYEFEDQERKAFVPWPAQWQRKWRPLRDPDDPNKILSDEEIDNLLASIRRGWNSRSFTNVADFTRFLKMRDQLVAEPVYGSMDSDISMVRFFDNSAGDKNENILADIRKLNEEQGMGNIKIPGTDIELINYSPCPKCGGIMSYSDVFFYYQNPDPDPQYSSKQEQFQKDTRVKCKECGYFFLPALIISDGKPRNEVQMLCRGQTIREVCMFTRQELRVDVLWMKNENILDDIKLDPNKKEIAVRAWRNDADANILKKRPTLFCNFLQFTPAPLMLNFLSRKNLEEKEPLFNTWVPKENIRNAYSW